VPELPEVETLRRGLAEHVVGRTIVAAELRLPKLLASGAVEELIGARVLAARRRAKHLLLETDRATLLVHLKLAGQVAVRAADGTTLASGGHPVPRFDAELPHKSTHLILDLDDGARLYLTDIRHFARIWIMSPAEAEARLAALGLGPEPLEDEFTPAALAATLRGRVRPLKPTLLDQARVSGLGNIYVDEALWRAQLTPTRPAGGLTAAEVERLHAAIRAVLHHAVTEGVAQVLDGKALPDSDFPAVHGRAGRPCPRCGTTIVKTRLGGRGTYTCPACQAASATDTTPDPGQTATISSKSSAE
jgi:formamidopyrimidine-DNA glycosylase